MKRLSRIAVLLLFGAIAACAPREQVLVILSTNDMHAHIERFPRLATAVERCRDTASVLLVDAGDRWTGNAYVDLVEGRRPVLELMHRLGYDLGTLGNHEFDVGQAVLEGAVDGCGFPVICANIRSGEGALLKPFEPTRILSRGGVTVGFVGVVTNYGPNGHPDGHDAIFEGLGFTDAVRTAAGHAPMKERCDVLVALTHIGSEKDRELADLAPEFDVVVGGHSHEQINEVRNGVLLTQTGKNLKHIGVTTIRMRKGRVEGISYRMIPLDNYDPDPEYQALVDAYYADPELQRPVGELSAPADKTGLAQLFAGSVRRAGDAEIGIYHRGGVRLDSLAGVVPIATVYDLDPFGSHVSTALMTPAQLRRMIVAKFNDTVNPGEAHCIDLFATTPYTVVTDDRGEAVDVRFPELEEGRAYRVAMGDYVFKNYRELDSSEGRTLDVLVTDCLLETLAEGIYTPDNRPRQRIE